jgi:hypothetical protein
MIKTIKNYFKLFQIKKLLRPSKDAIQTNNILEKHYIALYFSPTPQTIYQVEQWLSILNILNQKNNIIIITRKLSTFFWFSKNTDFSIVFCRSLNELMDFYEKQNLKIILYVNHGVENFQSLSYRDAYHIHINHGESEKTSTISNQANAYSYVFIVGPAAYEKYHLNLLKTDMKNFIQIGRPQLEHVPILNNLNINFQKKIILYAPTWEGTHTSMNYTSLETYALPLIHTILKNSDFYLIYKPHPNTGSRDRKIQKINQKIIHLLKNNISAKVILKGDINSLYPHIDIGIFDNSAVAIDYLYINKPMIMTNMFFRFQGQRTSPKIIHAARIVSINDIPNIQAIILNELKYDTKKQKRQKIKEYFLGCFNYNKQESTKTFNLTIQTLMHKRDEIIKKRYHYIQKNKENDSFLQS